MPESTRREELLEATANYLLANGVASLSLRPLAAAIGSKARLLVYHFGSRERLLIEAMSLIRARARKALETSMAAGLSDAKPDVLVRGLWKWSTSRRNRPYLRLLFEVHGLALQDPKQYAGYLRGAIQTWVELVATALKPRYGTVDAVTVATLIVGTIDGLLLDYLSTGDLQRATKALDQLAALLTTKKEKVRR
jgi:AcrR family transcriptional regulator